MRRVFFSFHFQNDAFKVGQIRNSWVGNSSFAGQPYLDKADWEAVKRGGDNSIQKWIDAQMNGTSVTVVLIGAQTLNRRWVRYEMQRTLHRGAGLIGITLAGMTNIDRTVEWKSSSTAGTPFERKAFGPNYPIYNWVNDGGRQNLGRWIEEAAREAGR